MKPFLEIIESNTQSPSLRFLNINLQKKNTHWHYHPEIELTYVLEGEGIRLVGDHVGYFKQRDLMLTGENLPHDFNMERHGTNAKFLVIQFKQALITTIPEMSAIKSLLQLARQGVLFSIKNKTIEQQLMSFSNLPPIKQVIALFNILHDLSELASPPLLCSDSFAKRQVVDGQLTRLNKVIDLVQQCYPRAIPLKEVAALSCMTEPSFCRWFKRTMGCSFVSYLNKCRVEQAARSLATTDKKVAIIASDCGFESLSSFNRAFKAYKGISPLKYSKGFQHYVDHKQC